MHRITGTASLLVLAACATATPELRRGWNAEQGAVLVPMSVAPAEGVRRVTAAFAAEGLAIENANAEAGFVTSSEIPTSTIPATVGRYRATVTGAAGSCQVALKITLRGVPTDPRAPGEFAAQPANVEAWRRLQRIADRLRGPAS